MPGLQLRNRVGRCYGSEIILFAQTAINIPGNRRGRGSFYATRISTKKNSQRNLRMSLVGVGNEPTDTRRRYVIVARSGLTKWSFIPAAIEARFAGTI